MTPEPSRRLADSLAYYVGHLVSIVTVVWLLILLVLAFWSAIGYLVWWSLGL